jgi:hypothetical protein
VLNNVIQACKQHPYWATACMAAAITGVITVASGFLIIFSSAGLSMRGLNAIRDTLKPTMELLTGMLTVMLGGVILGGTIYRGAKIFRPEVAETIPR